VRFVRASVVDARQDADLAAIRERDATIAEQAAEIVRLREFLARVPKCLTHAFVAGTEEREGGSARRQEKSLAPVETLRRDIAAALQEPRHD
jgi:hypothetical protein